MALNTYDGLKTAIASWLMREDLTAAIPDFIVLAEARIAGRLRVSEMETTATATLVNGEVELPDDFVEARRIVSAGTGNYETPLEGLTPVVAGQSFASSYSGVPTSYTISGNILRTYPNGGSAQVTMIYYAKPPSLAENSTNWLLAKAPGVYLYGALMEAAPYLEDDARIQTWGQLFEDAITRLERSDKMGRYGNLVTRVWDPAA